MAAGFIRVEVDGRAVRKALREVGHDMSDLKEANASAARIVADASRPRAPHKSGNLAKSIRGNRAVAKAVVSSRLVYGNPIHWGTGARRGLRGPHNIRPRPFLVEGARATEGEWQTVIVRALQKAIHEAGL